MSSDSSGSSLIVEPGEFEGLALAKIRRARERVTENRLQVLRVLARAEKPLTHGQIVKRLKDAGSAGDKNTVSRVLALFEETGVVVRTQTGFVPYMGGDPEATLTIRAGGRMIVQPLPDHITELLKAEAAPHGDVAVVRVEMSLSRDGEVSEDVDVGEE